MTDHSHELRRYSRKIGQPAGDVPSVMLAAAEEIERLAAKLEAAEKERDNANAAAVNIALEAERLQCENDALRAKIAATPPARRRTGAGCTPRQRPESCGRAPIPPRRPGSPLPPAALQARAWKPRRIRD